MPPDHEENNFPGAESIHIFSVRKTACESSKKGQGGEDLLISFSSVTAAALASVQFPAPPTSS